MFIGSISSLSSITVPVGDLIVVSASFASGSRFGGARYLETATTGSTPYRYHDAAGRWFELAEEQWTLDHFGGDPTASLSSGINEAAWARFIAALLATGRPGYLKGGGTYFMPNIARINIPNSGVVLRIRGDLDTAIDCSGTAAGLAGNGPTLFSFNGGGNGLVFRDVITKNVSLFRDLSAPGLTQNIKILDLSGWRPLFTEPNQAAVVYCLNSDTNPTACITELYLDSIVGEGGRGGIAIKAQVLRGSIAGGSGFSWKNIVVPDTCAPAFNGNNMIKIGNGTALNVGIENIPSGKGFDYYPTTAGKVAVGPITIDGIDDQRRMRAAGAQTGDTDGFRLELTNVLWSGGVSVRGVKSAFKANTTGLYTKAGDSVVPFADLQDCGHHEAAFTVKGATRLDFVPDPANPGKGMNGQWLGYSPFGGRLHINGASIRATRPREIAFTSGGTAEIMMGNEVVGSTSSATATVKTVKLSSGSWVDGTATGTLILIDQVGTFLAENLEVLASAGTCTIAANSSPVDPGSADAYAGRPALWIQPDDLTFGPLWIEGMGGDVEDPLSPGTALSGTRGVLFCSNPIKEHLAIERLTLKDCVVAAPNGNTGRAITLQGYKRVYIPYLMIDGLSNAGLFSTQEIGGEQSLVGVQIETSTDIEEIVIGYLAMINWRTNGKPSTGIYVRPGSGRLARLMVEGGYCDATIDTVLRIESGATLPDSVAFGPACAFGLAGELITGSRPTSFIVDDRSSMQEANLVTNGTFGGTSGWSIGSGWTINTATGRAVHTGVSGAGNLDQLIELQAGITYKVELTLLASITGSITLSLEGAAAAAASPITAKPSGTYVRLITAPLGATTLRISANAIGNVQLTDVRCAPARA
jgi:hypothetical protein